MDLFVVIHDGSSFPRYATDPSIAISLLHRPVPAHKSQHFVPRCYLRAFSTDNAGKTVNLFNLGSLKSVRQAAVKGQCSRPYFYGEDLKIEKALQIHESAYSDVVRLLQGTPPTLTTTGLRKLCDFLALQHSRTEAAVLRTRMVASGILKLIEQDTAARTDKLNASTHEFMRVALSMYPHVLRSISDLRACILVNHTALGFVTSDDPVVYSSRFHAERLRNPNFGIDAAGIFFALPLSPRFLLLCYDSDVYRVGGRFRPVRVIRTIHDVRACNELQLLNASNNVYFADWKQRHEVASHLRSVHHLRRQPRTEFLTYVPAGRDSSGTFFRLKEPGARGAPGDSIVRAASVHVFPTLWLTKLKFRWRVKYFHDGSMAGHVRRRAAQRRDREPTVKRVSLSLGD